MLFNFRTSLQFSNNHCLTFSNSRIVSGDWKYSILGPPRGLRVINTIFVNKLLKLSNTQIPLVSISVFISHKQKRNQLSTVNG